jgi:starvation-inducible DNA-binding protein
LHAFFEQQYETLAELIDEIAENVRQFGGVAAGTMTEFVKSSRLKEHPGRVPDENGMLEDLVHDHESIIRSLRPDIDRAQDELKAAEAADFLTGVLEKHNKIAWMLRSSIPSKSRNVEKKERFDDALVGSRS